MKTLSKTLLVLCFVQSMSSSSFANEGATAEFLNIGLTMTANALKDLSKDLTPKDSKSCPAGGSEVVPNLRSEKGKIFSIADRVDDVRDGIKPALRERETENKRCGACKQNNMVSLVTTISPEKTVTDPTCANRPAETFTVNLESKSSVKGFLESVLRGENAEGKRLHQGCPDPCSFYVTTAETEAQGDRTYLTLTVQCGQPRKDSLLTAKYDYKSGLVHQWTCSK